MIDQKSCWKFHGKAYHVCQGGGRGGGHISAILVLRLRAGVKMFPSWRLA